MGGRRRARSRCRRDLLLLRENHRRVLPALVRGAPCESRERAIPSDGRRCRARGVPALQEVQADRAAAREAACSNHRQGMSRDRDRGVDAKSGVARQSRRAQPSPFPSDLQGRYRADAAGVRGGASSQARARRAEAAADGDRGHLRRGVQFRRPLLRDVRRDAGHDAERLPRGRLAYRHSISPSASAPSGPFWSPRAQKASARSCSETIRTLSCAICRIAFLARR